MPLSPAEPNDTPNRSNETLIKVIGACLLARVCIKVYQLHLNSTIHHRLMNLIDSLCESENTQTKSNPAANHDSSFLNQINGSSSLIVLTLTLTLTGLITHCLFHQSQEDPTPTTENNTSGETEITASNTGKTL